jgi:uncharacterized protein (TIGR02271 family)
MQTVISAFDDRQTAQRAVDHLTEAGFSRSDVHLEERPGRGDAGSTTTTTTDIAGNENEDRGMLASIGHFFGSLFGDDDAEHAGQYSEAVRRGSSVVVVDARDEDQAERARDIMERLGAINMDERVEQWRSTGWTGYDKAEAQAGREQATVTGRASATQSSAVMKQPAPGASTQTQPAAGASTQQPMAADDSLPPGKTGVLDVVQEELQVGKRSVDRGGVRVIQRVSEKPVSELVRLRVERATVERRPVDRPATAEDLAKFREGTIEVRETAEEPVVSKTARVVEEVRVAKEVQEREETINETVRRKDVDVERIEGQPAPARQGKREHAVAKNAASSRKPLETDVTPGLSDREPKNKPPGRDT